MRQYIGARYTIKVYENSLDPSSAEWEQGEFEPLVLVTFNNSSYLSKKPVPDNIGDPASNPNYWVLTGAYNGQILQLQNDVNALRYGGFVTPETFGAVGDGVADDSSAFQDAVDSSRFIVLTGDYLIHDVTLSHPVYILGIGGTIKSDTTGGTLAYKNIFTITSKGVVIDGVIFTNDYRSSGTEQKYAAIDVEDVDDVKIINCNFDNFGFTYSNTSVAMWLYTPVILKAIDIKNVIFEDNIVDGGGGDELFMICPHNLSVSDCPEIHFNRNRMLNLVRGASINLMAYKIDIKDNYYYNFNYGGSVYNLSGYAVNISGNVFESCTSGSVYDGVEDGSDFIDTLIVDNEIYRGTTDRFIITSSRVIKLTNSEIEAGSFVFNDMGTHPSALVATMLQNTSTKGNGDIIIKDNNLKVTQSGGGALFRSGLGVLYASSTPDNAFPKMGKFAVINNYVKYASFFGVVNGKGFAMTNGLYDDVIVSDNMLDNPNTDNIAGSRRLLYIGDNRFINSSFKSRSLTVNNNSANCDNSIDGLGVFAIMTPGAGYKAFEYVNAYINNADIQVVGTEYDTLRTDI